MKKIIILTKINNYKKKNFAYLGKWALSDQRLDKETNIVNYHWDDLKKKVKDFIYLENLSFKISKYLYRKLNLLHNTKFSYKFWKFLLFPWIFRYVCTLFDRWESISFASKKYKKYSFLIFKNLTFNEKIKNYQDFINLCLTDYGNQKIYQDIILYRKKNIVLGKLKYTNSRESLITSVYLILKCFFFRVLYNKIFILINNLFIKNYIFYFVNVMGLNKKKFKFFDKVYNNNFVSTIVEKLNINIIYSFKPDIKKRFLLKEILNNEIVDLKSNFEKFIYKQLYKFIPESLVENFDNYLNKNFKISKSNFFLSSYIHSDDNYYKFKIAQQIENNSKYIILEHGGSFPLYLDYVNIEKKLCNFRLQWGSFHNKNYQLPTNPLSLLIKKVKFSEKKNKDLLIFSSFRARWATSLHTSLISSQQLYDLESLNIFRSFLDKNITKKILIKAPNISKKLSYDFDYLYSKNNYNNISHSSNINKSFSGARVIISTYPETTFSEALVSGLPTILIYSNKFHLLNKNTAPILEKMKNHNIVFNDPIRAANHVNKIWHNPMEWYNSESVVRIRKKFLEVALNIKQDLDKITKEKIENKNWNLLFKKFLLTKMNK